jgi:uncharacterized protein (UPF0332 family)
MIQPRDFLAQAERLLASDLEVDRRSAVSRAYYAAYHLAKNLVTEKCGVVLSKTADSHQAVQRCLTNSQRSQLRTAGSRLESLRGERNCADYNLTDPRFAIPDAAKFNVEVAKGIFDVIAAAELNPQSFQEDIRIYASGVLKLQLKTPT